MRSTSAFLTIGAASPAAAPSGAAQSGAAQSGADLGPMPEWNLADLYPSPDSPEVARDLAKVLEDARALKARYQGKLAGMGHDGAGLAQAIDDYERLIDVMGRLGSYSGLLYYANMADPARAKFYGDVREKLTNASSEFLFFELELNKIDEGELTEALKTPALARFKPWLDDLRKEKPFQLDEKLEQLFLEKSMTAGGAFDRLFNETMTELRFEVAGEPEPLALEPTLNFLMHPDRGRRQAAAEALAKVFQ